MVQYSLLHTAYVTFSAILQVENGAKFEPEPCYVTNGAIYGCTLLPICDVWCNLLCDKWCKKIILSSYFHKKQGKN